MLHLSEFIREKTPEILHGWEGFAKTLSPAADEMSHSALRDHAKEMLVEIAADMETPQSVWKEKQKSNGLQISGDIQISAASVHGAGRQVCNFTLEQLTAEYKALRANVLRLWLPQITVMDENSIKELMRFNEAIDQALAESIVAFTARTEYARDLFLAILGHDLRAPLQTVVMTSQLLLKGLVGPEQVATSAARIKRGAAFMNSMIDNLLGYARKQLGGGISVERSQVNLDDICNRSVECSAAMFPNRIFISELDEKLPGNFDSVQLQQLFTNLLCNAGQYGDKELPITMRASATDDSFFVEINNQGSVIPEASLKSIFLPLVQLPASGEVDSRPRTSLGLGLFIARQIAEAHLGEISLISSVADGTTFTVRIPKENNSP